ncbi:hypothetical protein D9M69_588750 [compost metagenome]
MEIEFSGNVRFTVTNSGTASFRVPNDQNIGVGLLVGNYRVATRRHIVIHLHGDTQQIRVIGSTP